MRLGAEQVQYLDNGILRAVTEAETGDDKNLILRQSIYSHLIYD